MFSVDAEVNALWSSRGAVPEELHLIQLLLDHKKHAKNIS